MRTYIFSLITVFASFSALAQKSGDELRNLITSKTYVFEPRTVIPSGGPTRQLNYNYELSLKGDTLVSYLPYFGRSYVANFSGEGPMDFRSTSFEYELTDRKKGGWEIIMLPRDTRETRQMRLTVTESGFATLSVTS